MIITNRTLSHIYRKHGITKSQVEDVLASADMVTKHGNNIKYYYKDDLIVIVTRVNKGSEWKVKTAYVDERGLIMGNIVYQR